MLDHLDRLLHQQLKKREDAGNLRSLIPANGLIDFASNDYLGLARSQQLASRVQERLNAMPITNGATGSRLLTGNSDYCETIERKLAKIFGVPDTTLFSSGYAANIAVLSSIANKNDTIIYDELSHASIKDGARLSVAKRLSFRHNDLDDLRTKIKSSTGQVFVVVESVYSMDGDMAPIQLLVTLSKELGFFLIVDEAHSTGLFGSKGGGLVVALGLEKEIPIRIYTFGKALGSHGACVGGSSKLKDFMVNFARPFIYTTALPNHSLASIEMGFELITAEIQSDLQNKIRKFTADSRSASPFLSPIQSLIVGGNANTKAASAQLMKKGFDVRPILSPTVKPGTERLRIILHTFNLESEIAGLKLAIEGLSYH